MEFRLELEPKNLSEKINHQDKILLIGSCFTEHIGSRLKKYKFDVLENPNGILFNPFSISKAIISYIERKHFTSEELFLHNEIWSSWDHHSRFSGMNSSEVLDRINQSQESAHDFIKKADWILITLGSAFVYQLKDGSSVANCHKMPSTHFSKKLSTIEEIISNLDNLIHRIRFFKPGTKIIFTISPVRHLRDGLIENNWSKSALIYSVQHLCSKFSGTYYFPAYELVIDDLRDYRFYAEDMVHPNYLATEYVWEKFSATCLNDSLNAFMDEMDKINNAINHKAFFPDSEAHQYFIKLQLERVKKLGEQYPYIDFSRELNFFSQATLI
ncbi:MAG: GSCFA domain-containing protein [Bacteroidetes bacterium]|nr:MAG: GSCFA domain-containing protein [Bacteroidota bacterium]